ETTADTTQTVTETTADTTQAVAETTADTTQAVVETAADASTGSTSGSGADSSSFLSMRGPAQSSQDALMSRLAAQRGGATTVPSVENPAPCPGAASTLCALTTDVSVTDSLAEAVASIIRALAFTGFTLLPWLAASFLLALAGALALAESRRREPFQNLG
ncbi:MAG: hypothetical protein H0T07_05740, partial [Actinobacteria bacterium]|nr:hypothetical protein [Actinomycetota bacterium]